MAASGQRPATSNQWRGWLGAPRHSLHSRTSQRVTESRQNYGTRDFSIKILIYYILSVSNISAGKRVHKCSLYIIYFIIRARAPPTARLRIPNIRETSTIQISGNNCAAHTYIHIVIHYLFYNINTRAAARRQCAGRGGRALGTRARARAQCPCHFIQYTKVITYLKKQLK